MGENIPNARFTGDSEGGMEDAYLPLLHSAAAEVIRRIDAGELPEVAAKESLAAVSTDALQVQRALHAITPMDLDQRLPQDSRIDSWTQLFERAASVMHENEKRTNSKKNPWDKQT